MSVSITDLHEPIYEDVRLDQFLTQFLALSSPHAIKRRVIEQRRKVARRSETFEIGVKLYAFSLKQKVYRTPRFRWRFWEGLIRRHKLTRPMDGLLSNNKGTKSRKFGDFATIYVYRQEPKDTRREKPCRTTLARAVRGWYLARFIGCTVLWNHPPRHPLHPVQPMKRQPPLPELLRQLPDEASVPLPIWWLDMLLTFQLVRNQRGQA